MNLRFEFSSLRGEMGTRGEVRTAYRTCLGGVARW